jgi:hypothetical protein
MLPALENLSTMRAATATRDGKSIALDAKRYLLATKTHGKFVVDPGRAAHFSAGGENLTPFWLRTNLGKSPQ